MAVARFSLCADLSEQTGRHAILFLLWAFATARNFLADRAQLSKVTFKIESGADAVELRPNCLCSRATNANRALSSAYPFPAALFSTVAFPAGGALISEQKTSIDACRL